MGEAVISGATVLASEAESGTTNFLVPNGTFFFILAIFLVVFGVIAKFVVQPVQKVLDERVRLTAQTALDNRRAAEQDAAAESEFKQELTSARSEAGGIRDRSRAEGRQVADELRAVAGAKVAEEVRQASENLEAQKDGLTPTLNASVESLSVALANRIIGVVGGR